jgi:DNA-binding CsgD family transcriptional regulator
MMASRWAQRAEQILATGDLEQLSERELRTLQLRAAGFNRNLIADLIYCTPAKAGQIERNAYAVASGKPAPHYRGSDAPRSQSRRKPSRNT